MKPFLREAPVEDWVADKLEGALQLQQAQACHIDELRVEKLRMTENYTNINAPCREYLLLHFQPFFHLFLGYYNP